MLNEQAGSSKAELVDELKLVREKGLPQLEQLPLPALASAAELLLSGGTDEAADVEMLLRRAVARLSGGSQGDALNVLFGLEADTRAVTAGVRRERAAQALGCSVRTLRRRHEAAMLEQVATQILVLLNERRLREGGRRLAAKHPVESEMAAHWVEMFQAYYRTWTPIYGLAADLTGYRSTLIEQPRPYDRRFGTLGPDDPGHSQEEQAEGYARFALYHYAHFEWQLKRFHTLYGGLWMLSDAEVEAAVRDAVYEIWWNVEPFNERDQSLLRTILDETPNQELHGFLDRLASSEVGRATHHEWQEWVATCSCTWPPGRTPETEYFPTSRSHKTISDGCTVHRVVSACGRYCELVDQDWLKIADWYRLDDRMRAGVTADRMYTDWRGRHHPVS
jgi:hypothetical protein